ncbi:MAG: SUMF1/EgtB/PvdO family nonheme iron enzyme [Treponema sp.]|nr:SUMF1/EgtB/PvdO family nonheme iron enzyme [Treponema sp.]
MKKEFQAITMIAFIGVFAVTLALTGCSEPDTGNTKNKTPVAADYNVSGFSQIYDGSAKAVNISPKAGKSAGAITIHYEGISGTAYSKETAAPSAVGNYAVTFDVAAVKGWNAKSGLYAGTLAIANQTNPNTVAAPSATPPAGEVASGAKITLASTTSGADIYYTTNGSNPTTGSAKYTAPFAVTPPVTVKAIAVKDGMTNSGILTAAYTLASGGGDSVAMVWVPGGTFTMGSPASEPNRYSDETQHEVTLSGFYIGKYQVTQDEYEAVMGSNLSSFKTAVSGESGTPGKLPVERVRWYDAIVFCNKLSIAEGLSPAYSINGSTDPVAWGTVPTSSNATWNAAAIVSSANGYRLPTEAQWEYACRAGTTTAYNTGAAISDNTGWYSGNSGNKTHQVGLKSANAWGLYDMHGNVWEWGWDWYGSYTSGAQTDPTGPVSGPLRVTRGGGWSDSAGNVRSACRAGNFPNLWGSDLGFRLLRP